MLPQSVPKSQRNQEIDLKISLDNARMTKRNKRTQETAGMELIVPGLTLSALKSPQNAHLWGIYISTESLDELEAEFGTAFQQVEALNSTYHHNHVCYTC